MYDGVLKDGDGDENVFIKPICFFFDVLLAVAVVVAKAPHILVEGSYGVLMES